MSERLRSQKVARRYCPGCNTDTLTNTTTCSWCQTDLGPIPQTPTVAWNMQRAIEATTLMHLTEPKP